MVTSGVSDEHSAAEFARCVRALLRNPMLDRSAGEVFGHVVKRQRSLQTWFAANCEWDLKVESEKGYARLRKLPADVLLPRPMMTTGRRQPVAFDRARYVLFCVVAATLREFPRGQVTLQELVKRVADRTAADDVFDDYTATGNERAAMVDVLTEMDRLGVIRLVDHRGDYELQTDANALYDIDEHRLVDLFVVIKAAKPSAVADRAGTIANDKLSPTQQRFARKTMMRRLLDDPVVYTDDLSEIERRWVATGTKQLRGLLSNVGLELEVRKDGWCAIDPTSESTDVEFPRLNAIVDQATLMVCVRLTADEDQLPYWIPSSRLTTEISRLLLEQPSWAKTYRKPGGGEQLASQVGERLCAFALARSDSGGMALLPALGRFRQVVISGQENR